MEDKQFWIQLGQDLGETKQLSQDTRSRLEKFITNDFEHAVEKIDKVDDKVDKLTNKVAWIVGIISALTLAGNALLRVL